MNLTHKRVLITQADRFMGPALVEGFVDAGADVIANQQSLDSEDAVNAIVSHSGNIDVLIANLAYPRPDKLVHELTDSTVIPLFEALVYPLVRLGSAVLPQMVERRAGKILVMGSAAPMRAFPRSASYAAARAAQLAWMRCAAHEVAPHNVQVNAIAQNFVENPEYFSAQYQASEEFKRRLVQVPAGRLGTAYEDVNLAKFLCSDACNFLTGAAVPFTGGWSF